MPWVSAPVLWLQTPLPFQNPAKHNTLILAIRNTMSEEGKFCNCNCTWNSFQLKCFSLSFFQVTMPHKQQLTIISEIDGILLNMNAKAASLPTNLQNWTPWTNETELVITIQSQSPPKYCHCFLALYIFAHWVILNIKGYILLSLYHMLLYFTSPAQTRSDCMV